MDMYTETEVSYKNGYKDGYEAAKRDTVGEAYWIVLTDCANEGVYCSHCSKKVYRVDYSNTMKLKSKYCPHCGFIMNKIVVH